MKLQESLTERQQAIFDFIRQQIDSKGAPPTIREIAGRMRFRSPNGVVGHLKSLEKKGLIRRTSNKSRSIVLTDAANEETRGLPLAGRVSAGSLLEAVEQYERIDVGSLWNSNGNYVLEVDGDSMIDAQIASGDYVIVQSKRTAHAGDIVVARTVDGEATLKYWFPEKNRIRLQPANRRMKPIFATDVKVLGVVVGVVRKIDAGFKGVRTA
jgi:repressor LexA